MKYEFVRFEDIFFGLSTDFEIKIATIFTNRQGPYLKQRSRYGSVPYSMEFLENFRQVFDLERYEHVIVGGYMDKWAPVIQTQQMISYIRECKR